MVIRQQCQRGSPAAEAGEVGLVRVAHGRKKVVASDSLAVVPLEVQIHALPASEIRLVDACDSIIRAAIDRPSCPRKCGLT